MFERAIQLPFRLLVVHWRYSVLVAAWQHAAPCWRLAQYTRAGQAADNDLLIMPP